MPLYEDLIRRALTASERAEALQKESRRVLALARFLREADSGERLLVHCAWCGRLQIGEEWLTIEAVGGGTFSIAQSVIRKSSHGICPSCFDQVSASADAERAAG